MPEERLLIVGTGLLYARLRAQWPVAAPQRAIHSLELSADGIPTLATESLAAHPTADTQIFAALDATALNFARLDLYGKLRLLGYRAATFIHPRAIVEADATFGENCYIGEGAIIGAGARIAHNCFIGAGAQLGLGVRVAQSVWIDHRGLVGDRAAIGAHTVLASGVIIAPGIKVGAYCEIEIAGCYTTDVPARTYLHSQFGAPVTIYSA